MWGKINLYKPEDMSSREAVDQLRKILSIRRIGHSGTLDPMARGVLNCFVGRAARFITLLDEDKKTYEADFQLGKVSDTLDLWGQVKSRSFKPPSKEALEEVLKDFLGESYQIPPMYSAIKYQGRALHSYARQGIEVERKKRKIIISSLKLLDYDGKSWGRLEIVCSRGTYVRALINDIGKKLETGAIMTDLVRTRNDWVDLDQCYSIDEIKKMHEEGDWSFLLPPSFNVDLPRVQIDKEVYEDLAQGRTSIIDRGFEDGRYLVYYKETFVGTALCEDGILRRERIVKVDNDS